LVVPPITRHIRSADTATLRCPASRVRQSSAPAAADTATLRCPGSRVRLGSAPAADVPLRCGSGYSIGRVRPRSHRMAGVRGRADDRVNRGRLDPKDCYGWRALEAPDRLTRPLVRKDGELEEADWDTAMGRIVERSRSLLERPGGWGRLGFYATGQLLLEEYYTLAVIGKAGIGTPHMDGNTRLCTATAASALKATFGTDGQPGSYTDVDHCDAIALFGHNVAETQVSLWSCPDLRRRARSARRGRRAARDERPLALDGAVALLSVKPGHSGRLPSQQPAPPARDDRPARRRHLPVERAAQRAEHPRDRRRRRPARLSQLGQRTARPRARRAVERRRRHDPPLVAADSCDADLALLRSRDRSTCCGSRERTPPSPCPTSAGSARSSRARSCSSSCRTSSSPAMRPGRPKASAGPRTS
jgi:hypothetical protein